MQIADRLALDSARENLQHELDLRWINATAYTPAVARAARLAARLSPQLPGGWTINLGSRGTSPAVILA